MNMCPSHLKDLAVLRSRQDPISSPADAANRQTWRREEEKEEDDEDDQVINNEELKRKKTFQTKGEKLLIQVLMSELLSMLETLTLPV